VADDNHLNGCMIALMPTADEARRLAVKGGEAAADLHLTLFFLADDSDTWNEDQRADLLYCMSLLLEMFDHGPVTGNIFGAAHWNADGPKPSWVWSVGDGDDSGSLEMFRQIAVWSLEDMHDQPELPRQHCPWVAHICAEYSDDLTVIKELEKRLGPVTFDRIRVSFGSEDHDFPLTGQAPAGDALTAAAVFRRQPTELETASRADFTMIDKQWKDAVGATLTDYARAESDQRAQLREQITTAVDRDDLSSLDSLHVDTDHMAGLLFDHMRRLAITAGKEMQREAEHQGIEVPPWDLDVSLTASSAIDVLRGVAKVTARALGLGLVQSAGRRAMTFITSGRSGRQVADLVDRDLKDLSPGTPRRFIGSAMSSAQNAGRYAVLNVAPAGTYLASEIMDKNTCGPCREIDGTEFTSLSAAAEAYPAGSAGYVSCAGGGACRGTMIAVWNRAEIAGGSQQEASMSTVTESETLGGKPNPGTKPDKRIKGNKYADTTEDCPPGEDCEESMSAGTSDVKADLSAVAIRPEEITLTEDGRIVDADGSEVVTPFADDGGCPPNMMKDPATGECGPMPDGGASTAATAAWEGVLAVEDQVTGDGREFAAGALSWPDSIEPGEVLLRWNKEDSHGGEVRTKAVTVGRIDSIWRDGNKIMGKGVFDLGSDDGAEAHRRVQEKFLRGVSIDADSIGQADVEFVWPEDANMGEDGEDALMMLFAQPDKVVFHGGRIRAATLCDIPAFAEAYIALLDEAGAVLAGGAPTLEEGVDVQIAIDRKRGTHSPKVRRIDRALIAHGGAEWRPPAEWFANPQLSQPTTIHVTEEGRIFGHAAQWGACHIGFMDVCTQPPREDDFPYFLTGELVTASGAVVPVGQITVTANHADLYAGAGPAKEHYENTGNAVADVTVGSDRIGIWVAGAIRPNADPDLVHELRASGEVSGDWRRIGGAHRLVGLLGVNVGGFVVPRMRARVAGGQVQALVAAGRLTTAHEPVTTPAPMDLQTARRIVIEDLASQMTEGSE
jgi:hypothetical protein